MTIAEEVYKENGMAMRNFNSSERYLISCHPNFRGFERTTVFKFDDGSEVELHQSASKRKGQMMPTSCVEAFYEGPER
jgi:hypothetical protein